MNTQADTTTDEEPRRVLLIEDSSFARLWLRTQLSADGLVIEEAADGLTGLEACLSNPPDLILLDLNLPLYNGFEILRRLKEDRRTMGIPVIVVSSASKPMDKALGLDLGAVDFISKPYDPLELRARIRVAFRTRRLQELLEQRAHLDGLTGLSNRIALDDRLGAEWAIRQRHGGSLAIWMVDLDHFKRINDTYGHSAGDDVLRRTANGTSRHDSSHGSGGALWRRGIRGRRPLLRYLGAVKTAERFRMRIASSPMVYGTNAIHVTVSIGVASAPDDGISSPADLIARADEALYQAKAHGRNQVHPPPWNSQR